VFVYQLFDGLALGDQDISVDLMVGDHILETLYIPTVPSKAISEIHRLAAKALIQELQYSESGTSSITAKEEITKLSLSYQILSPYTAFVGVERKNFVDRFSGSNDRLIPIQLNEENSDAMSVFSTNPTHTNNRVNLDTDFHLMPNVVPQRTAFYGQNNIIQPTYSIQQSENLWDSQNSMQLGIPIKPEIPMQPEPSRGSQSSVPSEIPIEPQITPIHESIIPDNNEYEPSMVLTTPVSLAVLVPVQWFIERQSFNGAWVLNDTDVSQINRGKSLNSITVTGDRSRHVITTALAIAVLESKYNDQMRLWQAAVSKARKQLEREGLTYQEANALIDEIKSQI